MINEDSKWKIMRALVPPKDLAAIIKRVADGTINMESAKVVFNTIYEQNIKKLNEDILKDIQMTWPFPPHPMPVPANAPPVKFNPDNHEDALI
jgi:hypothetical protein